jgi:hypothetical protein
MTYTINKIFTQKRIMKRVGNLVKKIKLPKQVAQTLPIITKKIYANKVLVQVCSCELKKPICMCHGVNKKQQAKI